MLVLCLQSEEDVFLSPNDLLQFLDVFFFIDVVLAFIKVLLQTFKDFGLFFEFM